MIWRRELEAGLDGQWSGLGFSEAAIQLLDRSLNAQNPAVMLRWALIFLIVALIAAMLGFGGIAGTAAEIARVLFFVFPVLLVISLLSGAFRGRPPG
jgi:uncharacterized membrane protein YtjA (UPF0391 family)